MELATMPWKKSPGLKVNGQTLEYHRKLKRFTQEELAAKANVSIKTIQRAEKNGNLNPHTLIQIAQILNVSPSELTTLPTPRVAPRHPIIIIINPTTPELQEWLSSDALRKVLSSLHILDVLKDGATDPSQETGSIIIRCKLTSEDADRLLAAHKNNLLAFLGATAILTLNLDKDTIVIQSPLEFTEHIETLLHRINNLSAKHRTAT